MHKKSFSHFWNGAQASSAFLLSALWGCDCRCVWLTQQECKNPLEGAVVSVNGKVFHSNCFACSLCKWVPLHRLNNVWWELCDTYRTPITGPCAVKGGKRICATCEASTCWVCDGPVPESRRVSIDSENIVELLLKMCLEKSCHLGCTVCKVCRAPLAQTGGKGTTFQEQSSSLCSSWPRSLLWKTLCGCCFRRCVYRESRMRAMWREDHFQSDHGDEKTISSWLFQVWRMPNPFDGYRCSY